MPGGEAGSAAPAADAREAPAAPGVAPVPAQEPGDSSAEAPDEVRASAARMPLTPQTEYQFDLDADADTPAQEIEEFYSYVETPIALDHRAAWEEWCEARRPSTGDGYLGGTWAWWLSLIHI